MGVTNFDVVQANQFIGMMSDAFGDIWYVDGSFGSDGNSGKSPSLQAFATIAKAIDLASARDTIVIAAKTIPVGDTDPVSYAEALTIPVAKHGLTLMGVGGRVQGSLPQIKKGSGAAALLTIRAPGCRVLNLGFNGAGSTGGGILLDDDGSTKLAFGTEIANCHFKNCKGSTATDAKTGGAIQWSSDGGAWQVWIHDNRFYKNVGGIVLKGTSQSVPQDVVIENNTFGGPAASVDCYMYLAGGSGMSSVTVRGNVFASVLPVLGSGAVVRYVHMTGCSGIFVDNHVGGSYTTTGFGFNDAAAVIPTTVGIVHNYSDAGLIVREA